MRDLVRKVLSIENEDLLTKIVGMAQVRKYAKGDEIYRIGEYQEEYLVLIDGVCCCEYISARGITETLVFCEVPGYPLNTLQSTCVAGSNCIALAPTRILTIPVKQFTLLAENSTELLWMMNRLMAKAILLHSEIAMALRSYSALQRCAWFYDQFPLSAQHASNVRIASFLGMTPETFSRQKREYSAGKGVDYKPLMMVLGNSTFLDSVKRDILGNSEWTGE